MQEAGVPSHTPTSRTRTTATAPPATSTSRTGRARPATSQQLKDYDDAFGKFFNRLAADGINKSQHAVRVHRRRGRPLRRRPADARGCDGVTRRATTTASARSTANLRRDDQDAVRRQHAVHRPLRRCAERLRHGQSADRDQTDPAVRGLEREMAQLDWMNPYTGSDENNIMVALADQTEMKTLHMVTADPSRTPTFTPFADPDWFFFASNSPASCATQVACAFIPAEDRSELRLGPRRHPGRDRFNVDRCCRPGSQATPVTTLLDRPHRRTPNDALTCSGSATITFAMVAS